jgi:hypothetical protein
MISKPLERVRERPLDGLNFDAYIYVYKVCGGIIFPAKDSTARACTAPDAQQAEAPRLLFMQRDREISPSRSARKIRRVYIAERNT